MFKTVLFDIDGVMLSEERYFDASALTIHELLSSPSFMGLTTSARSFTTDLNDLHIQNIRQSVFQNNVTLEALKNVGVNANWDMVYLCFVAELATVLRQFRGDKRELQTMIQAGWTREALQGIGSALCQSVDGYSVEWTGYRTVYASAKSRTDLFSLARNTLGEQLAVDDIDEHGLWTLCQETFQEWYLGDEYSGKEAHKAGFLTSEIPIVDPPKLADFFGMLTQNGISIGIATGRPRTETEVPLSVFGWWQHFRPDRVSTASEVLEAESVVPSARPLSKPSPYSYLRSLKASSDVVQLLDIQLPIEGLKEDVLIIGDSIADALAAKRLGVSFAAVLTGLEGEAARPKFEELQADYIFNDVLQVKELFGVLK